MRRIPTQAEWVQKFGKPALILPIKGYWLNRIWRGEKREEYRDDKPYYRRMLEKYRDFPNFGADRKTSCFSTRTCLPARTGESLQGS